MAKKKEVASGFAGAIDFDNLATLSGGELLENCGVPPCFIDTGVLALNWVSSGKFVGGGIPGGSCIEVYGESSSGKTLIGTNFLKGAQKAGGVAAFMDAEKGISKDFAVKASHVDPKKFLLVKVKHLEGAFNDINKVIRLIREDLKVPFNIPIVIVYDSIAASPSKREYAETLLDMETATEKQIKDAGGGSERPGERGKICSAEFRKLIGVVGAQNACVVFINQLRSKIGVLFGNPLTNAGGGKALEYYCDNRLQAYSSKQILDSVGNVIGVNIRVKNMKNRCTSPFKEVSGIRLFFDQGIDPFGGLLEALLKCKRVLGSGGNYIINPQYTNGEEVNFKSSKEKNTVPVDLLLKYPSLVDANNKEEIQYYIDMFNTAIEASNDETNVETDFNVDLNV